MASYLQKIWLKIKKKITKEKIRQFIPNEIVNDFFHLPKSIMAVLWYLYPAKNLYVIGITGTDGKTTTANIVYHILKTANCKVSLISTVKAVIGDKEYNTGFHVTNPDSFALQRLIYEAKESGSKYLVLEATSHGLVQHRNFGTNIAIGVITNISHEHLDYHKTMKNYVLAKAKILNGVKYSILNRDDKYFRLLKNKYSGRLFTFGLDHKADFTLKTFPFKTKLYGRYNRYNCLASIAVAKTLGISDEIIRDAIQSFKGVQGRMEEVGRGRKFRLFIDFAHKPNALKNVLKASRKLIRGNGRLIVMFGAAGLRDSTKRPLMGEIAGTLADVSIITSEDPRTENVNKIIKQIEKGMIKTGVSEQKITNTQKKAHNKHFYRIIVDRRKAINWIIKKLAKKNDIILFCGKGHEQSFCIGKTEYPWDEKNEILNALKK